MLPQQPVPIDRKKMPKKTSARRVKKIKIIKPKVTTPAARSSGLVTK